MPMKTEDARDPAALRIALVGGGKMGRCHLDAIRRLPDLARVVAVADASATALFAWTKIAPGVARYETVEDLLAREQVDVVHVCTAPSSHAALARHAIEAGCSVYVEKPFVPTGSEAASLITLARRKGVKLCAGHQLLFERPTREALDLLPAVGDLVHVESFFSFRTVRRAPDGRSPLSADEQLLDVVPHPIYLLLRFLERAAPVEPCRLTALQVSPGGTVHALVTRGTLTGSLVVTLEGRPIESYVRLVGANGTVQADFVRGTVQRLLGPGTSGVDKVLNPYRLGWQHVAGTTGALASRLLNRQRSYPGLVEIIGAFYRAIQAETEPPVSDASIRETVEVWEQVAAALRTAVSAPPTVAGAGEARILVTGGTGFLGREVVRALVADGSGVRVLGRRLPSGHDRIGGVDYAACDLSTPVPPALLAGIDTIIHCAAETVGGWEAHRRNSLGATKNLVHAAVAAGVGRIIHVSSLGVLARGRHGEAISEQSPLHESSDRLGPYVWGKLESERLVQRLGQEHGIEVRIVRPGALVDYQRFDPPGRLGKRVGNLFVAVGSPGESLGVAEVDFTGRTIAWLAAHFDTAPACLNILSPHLPTRRDLVGRLRRMNPDLTVVWLPHLALKPLSWLAIALQKALRPGRPAIDAAKVFAPQRFDVSRIARLAATVEGARNGPAPHRDELVAAG